MYTPGKLIAVILYVIFIVLCPATILWYFTSALGLVALLALFILFGGLIIDAKIEQIKEPWTEWDE